MTLHVYGNAVFIPPVQKPIIILLAVSHLSLTELHVF